MQNNAEVPVAATLERAPAEPAHGIVPGTVLRSLETGTTYHARRRLGAGAFGAVWLCREGAGGEKRAVKVLGAERRAELAREVMQMRRALERGGEFAVPQLHEACEASVDGQPNVRHLLIAMQFVDGITLSALGRAHAGTLSCHVGCSVLGDLCNALDRLHSNGIVHRDIKGDNVMVSREGPTYLCDFGLCGLVEELRDERSIAGTPDFMAPELLGRVPRYSTKSDVWAFGICAIELETGTTPARAQNFLDPAQVIEWIATTQPPEVPLVEGWPAVFQNSTQWCLVRDPDERVSCGELLRMKCQRFYRPFSQRMYQTVRYCLETHHPPQFDDGDE